MAQWGRELDCLARPGGNVLPVHAVRPEALDTFLTTVPDRAATFLRQSGFAAAAGSVVLVPGESGAAGAVLGLGGMAGPLPFAALAYALPEGAQVSLAGVLDAPEQAVLGFCMGAYRFHALKSSAPARGPAHLVPPPGCADALVLAQTIWLVRDLINWPANLLGPAELAEAAVHVLAPLGAEVTVCDGEHLAVAYPLIEAVGRGSPRSPRVVIGRWRGSGARQSSPLVSLCGKGVCFDTGGNDLKTGAAMLRMKKDMGGAAIALGLARLIVLADLPVRLEVRLGCVENSLSGSAMRPMDVLRSRRGLTVSVGNTDAEGRLVLADLLAEACDARPDILMDFATLTGAARVALGPDLPALFCNDDVLAERMIFAGRAAHDPVWRLPLFDSYNCLLDSYDADLNNVADKPYAGAIVAALFLQRFIAAGQRWLHLDLYAWNDGTRLGRPEGGEAQTLRAAYGMILHLFRDPTRER